jgi:hypothetical protein
MSDDGPTSGLFGKGETFSFYGKGGGGGLFGEKSSSSGLFSSTKVTSGSFIPRPTAGLTPSGNIFAAAAAAASKPVYQKRSATTTAAPTFTTTVVRAESNTGNMGLFAPGSAAPTFRYSSDLSSPAALPATSTNAAAPSFTFRLNSSAVPATSTMNAAPPSFRF